MKLKDFDFRIWDNTEKRYLNEIELHKYDKSPVEAGTTFTETDRINEVEFVKNKNDLEIELFTGYFDKNGNKIYENDILMNELTEEIFYITRDDTYKMSEIILYGKDCNGNLYRKRNPGGINLLKMLVSDKNMSVVGNIHENKELLKV